MAELLLIFQSVLCLPNFTFGKAGGSPFKEVLSKTIHCCHFKENCKSPEALLEINSVLASFDLLTGTGHRGFMRKVFSYYLSTP